MTEGVKASGYVSSIVLSKDSYSSPMAYFLGIFVFLWGFLFVW